MRVKQKLRRSIDLRRVQAAAPSGFGLAWVNELPHGDDAWHVVKQLGEARAFKLSFAGQQVRLGAAEKRKLVEEWKQAGSPRIWL